MSVFFFFQAEDGIRDIGVTGVQTCALPILRLMEKPFDFKALAERLSRVFPGLVKIREDVGAIIVMDKIKVTQAGIEEGSGLAADRVKSIYDEFTRETRK